MKETPKVHIQSAVVDKQCDERNGSSSTKEAVQAHLKYRCLRGVIF